MSRKITLQPVKGQWPWIESKVVGRKRQIRLAIPPDCITEWHVHFDDAAVEWNDIAGRMFMQEILERAEKD